MRRNGLMLLAVGLLWSVASLGQSDSGLNVPGPAGSVPDSLQARVEVIQEDTSAQTVKIPAVLPQQDSAAASIIKPLPTSNSIAWPIAYGLFGLIIGAAGCKILMDRSTRKQRMKVDAAEAKQEAERQQLADEALTQRLTLEQEHAALLVSNKALMAENEQLKRNNSELEGLLRSASDAQGSGSAGKGEVVFYMPQPNMNGRFQEASRRTESEDALYAFTISSGDLRHATFEFIARDAYLNAAIGNEPSWIAIACDRTNQPSGTTTRVKTELPGMATLKDGEWEITRKARITYL